MLVSTTHPLSLDGGPLRSSEGIRSIRIQTCRNVGSFERLPVIGNIRLILLLQVITILDILILDGFASFSIRTSNARTKFVSLLCCSKLHLHAPLTVFDGVIHDGTRIAIADTHLRASGVVHQVNMPSVGKSGVTKRTASLDYLANLDLGLLCVTVPDVIALFERTYGLKNLNLDNSITLGLECRVTWGALTPPATGTNIDDLAFDHCVDNRIWLTNNIKSVVNGRVESPRVLENSVDRRMYI